MIDGVIGMTHGAISFAGQYGLEGDRQHEAKLFRPQGNMMDGVIQLAV